MSSQIQHCQVNIKQLRTDGIMQNYFHMEEKNHCNIFWNKSTKYRMSTPAEVQTLAHLRREFNPPPCKQTFLVPEKWTRLSWSIVSKVAERARGSTKLWSFFLWKKKNFPNKMLYYRIFSLGIIFTHMHPHVVKQELSCTENIQCLILVI